MLNSSGAEQLHGTVTVEEWLEVLIAARTVVVVTARENYQLEILEKSGLHGLAKYDAAGISWAGDPPTFTSL